MMQAVGCNVETVLLSLVLNTQHQQALHMNMRYLIYSDFLSCTFWSRLVPWGFLALSFCGHESIRQKREAQRYIVALIRSAKAYRTRGGGLSGATNAHQVLSKLKTVADASSFLKVKVDPNSSSTGLFLKGKQSEQRLDLPIRGLVWRSSLTLKR